MNNAYHLAKTILTAMLNAGTALLVFGLLGVLALGAIVSASGSLALLEAGAPPMQGGGSLQIDAPGQVDVGEAITVILTVQGASDIAGFETAINFDRTAAEFAGVRQRESDVRGAGRDIVPLAVVQTPSGAAIGFASCPVPDCITRQGNRAERGGAGSVKLAEFDILPLQPGTLDINLDALKFVNSAGNPVPVQVPNSTISVQVGEGGVGYPAPGTSWSLEGRTPAARGPFDLTRPGIVTHADAMEVALEWTSTRERGAPCNNLSDARLDVNQDGCIDVADIQLILANHSPASARAPSENQAEAALTFVVDSTGDEWDSNVGNGICRTAANTCTLRAAIQEANAHNGPDSINFSIPGGGIKTIQLNTFLYTISDTTGGVTIDGYTQPGSSPNSDGAVDNAVLMIQVAGQGETNFDAFRITSPNNTIRGLSVFKAHRAFWIYGSNANNNGLFGNFIGTDAVGSYNATATADEQAQGVHIEQGASNNRIGGTSPADRNVISGNGRSGVGFWHVGTMNNVVINNLVGMGPNGTTRRPNRVHGLDVNFGAASNILGGTNPGERNVLSGNNGYGAEISHTAGTTQNRIVGNYIGTDVSGNNAPSNLYNAKAGISVKDRVINNIIADNVIGNNREGGIRLDNFGTCCATGNQFVNNRIGIGSGGNAIPNLLYGFWVNAPQAQIGPDNIIANNQGAGVQIEGPTNDRNLITRNSIFNNVGLGIDLAPIGQVNANDDGDGDGGPNQQLNFPVITGANTSQVTGTACANCAIELFVADSGAGTNGEGQTFIGAGTAQGDGNFAIAVSGVSEGQFVTGNATDADNNTSEFAGNFQVSSGPPQPTPTPPPPVTNWQSSDIGTSNAGQTTVNGSAVTVRGSGKDIWGTADSFRYVYESISGDVELTAQVTDWNGKSVNAWSKGGLMLRNSTAPGAANVFVMLTGNNGLRMQWRTGEGATTALSSSASHQTPMWLRLIKVGNQVSAYYSPDNANWSQLGNTVNIGFGTDILYGMAVTAHKDGLFVNAAFDNISAGSPSIQAFAPPALEPAANVHIGDLRGVSSADGKKWIGVIDVTVHNDQNKPISFATVSGILTGGASGEMSCTTDATGRCALLVDDLPKSAKKVVFKLKDVAYEYAPYAPNENHRKNPKKNGNQLKLKPPKN